MEIVEHGDVESSYLLAFLDDQEGFDEGILAGFDDLEYSEQKRNIEKHTITKKFEDKVYKKASLVEELDDSMIASKKGKSLNSTPRKKPQCIIGCNLMDDLEINSRQRSLHSSNLLSSAPT